MNTSSPQNPLHQFTRLSQSVYIYNPSDFTEGLKHDTVRPNKPTGTRPPDTLLILAWASSLPRNIAKYTSSYMALYPTTRIILVRTEFVDFLIRPGASHQRLLKPAVDALCARPNDRLLVHFYSNGGAFALVKLAEKFQEIMSTKLPVRRLICDSGPGTASFQRTSAATVVALPKAWYIRIPGTILLYAFFTIVFTSFVITGKKNSLVLLRKALNDPEKFDVTTRRCYLYSKSDDMVLSDDVLEHAREASEKGWSVQKEEFAGGKHVALVRVDEKRYWSTVEKFWEDKY